MAGAGSLAELQLRIYDTGWADEIAQASWELTTP